MRKVLSAFFILFLPGLFLTRSSLSNAQTGISGAAFEGGRGLYMMQSARTYGAGSWALGIQALGMQREYVKGWDKNNSVLMGVPLTIGLTNEVDITGSIYFMNDVRPNSYFTNTPTPYGTPESGIGASRIGLKVRAPFPETNRIQIAAKLGAMLDTSDNQSDGMLYRWTRAGTDVEGSFLETIDLGSYVSVDLEQGYVLSGSKYYDDQYVLGFGLDIHPNDRISFGIEANNRVFDSIGPQSLKQAENLPANYYNGAAGVGNPYLLKDNDLDFMNDYFVIAPSVNIKIFENVTFNAGAVINIADQVDPKETAQFAVGFTFTGKMGFLLDTDHDGVKNNRDMEPKTPYGFPVDLRGVSVDTDHDGVPDGKDYQILTPRGAKVDKNGVALDSDGDGVYDGIDKEPNTPKCCPVDAYGVAIDEDADGVPDCLDKQPDTLAGCPVDSDGVALDDDSDGVPNCKDLEPSTPKGSRVDQHGRAVKELKKEEKSLIEEGTIRLNNIFFASGSSKIQPESFPALKNVALILEKYPTLKIQIEGHTDSAGKRPKNLQLSQERAQAVLDFLLTMSPKLKREQFLVVGFGPDKPIASNNTVEGRQMNRRVVFVVLNKDELKKLKQ